jgi:L-asparaginase
MFTGMLKKRQGHLEAQEPLAWGYLSALGTVKASPNFYGTSTYLRSVLKPYQADVLFQALAHHAPKIWQSIPAEAWVIGLSSHSGEDLHQQGVLWWLEQAHISLSQAPQALVCGCHPPLSAVHHPFKEALQPWHHNCSGQHAMILALCRALSWPMEGYHLAEHPFFQATLGQLQDDLPGGPIPWGVDGCHLPTPYMSLENTLRLMQQLILRSTGKSLINWMKQSPFLVAGTDRFDTQLGALPYPLVSKGGAEGLLVLWHIERQETLLIKSLSGNATARNLYAWHLLAHLGWIPQALALEMAPLRDTSPFAVVPSDLEMAF